MGAGIASVAVQQGTLVRLKDTDTRASRGARGGARRAQRATHEEADHAAAVRRQHASSAARPTTPASTRRPRDRGGVRGLDGQARVLREVEPMLDDDGDLASNTSTIPIARIAEAARRPERVLGMHFFSPVHKMPLLEVIVTRDTDDEATATAVAYGKKLGKTVIVVNDGARLLHQAHPLAVHQRGRPPARRGCGDRADRRRAGRLRLPRRPDHAHRRGRASTSAARGRRCCRGVR